VANGLNEGMCPPRLSGSVRRTVEGGVSGSSATRKLLFGLIVLQAVGCAKLAPSGPYTPESRVGSEQERSVIRSGNLELRGKDLSHIKSEIDRLVHVANGWVESWAVTDTRYLSMTLRVPEASLDDTMNQVSTLGRVVSRSLRSQDVTEEVIDLEARLNNLRALRDRLKAYLDRASDLKEILEVERELTRVQTEIEAIEGKLKVLRSRVSMSELRVTVRKGR